MAGKNVALIRKIEFERVRISVILEMADLTLRESEVTLLQLNAEAEKTDAELEEARAVLRSAGLLRD